MRAFLAQSVGAQVRGSKQGCWLRLWAVTQCVCQGVGSGLYGHAVCVRVCVCGVGCIAVVQA